MICVWNGREEDGSIRRSVMLGVSVRKIKTLTVKMETVTWIGSSR
jgi:hypothetical protein